MRLAVLAIFLTAAMNLVGHAQVQKHLLGIGQAPQTPSATTADEFFDDNVVHDIFLTINSKDWQSLKDHFLDNTYYPCDLHWRDQIVRNVGIRSRGNASRSDIKPSLRVDFDRYSTTQTFLGLKSFVLRNNIQDPSNLRERLSMLLFRRMNVPASREAHTRLFVNNDYIGLYTTVESVDKAFLKRTYGEDTGYLFNYEHDKEYYFEDLGSKPELYVPSPFQPETHENDSRPEFLVDLIRTLNQASDATFETAMADYLDLTKFIRHVAVESFLTETDGLLGDAGLNNFYFYRFQDKKLFTFVPWDKSATFNGYTVSIWRGVNLPPAQRNRLMERVLSLPDLYDLYLDSLLECVRSANETVEGSTDQRGWLEREIDREYSQIRDAALSDPQKAFTSAEVERSISELNTFARNRGNFVAAEVSQARGH